MTKNIDEIIKDEIKMAYERSKVEVEEIKVEYEEAKEYLKKLKKALTCDHEWDDGIRGLQINTDECKKCGWSHCY